MKKNESSCNEMIWACVIVAVVVFVIGFGCGNYFGSEREKKANVVKIDSLKPYDRVFFGARSHCFHRDYNCEALSRTKELIGVSMLIAEEEEELVPCKKCTEPYGIIHHISPKDYQARFKNTQYEEPDEEDE